MSKIPHSSIVGHFVRGRKRVEAKNSVVLGYLYSAVRVYRNTPLAYDRNEDF